MEFRRLGASGFTVPALSYGCGRFACMGDFSKEWGTTRDWGPRPPVDICLDAGVSMFDSADVYSAGESERILGTAIKGRRGKVIVSTKATFRSGEGANEVGSSRSHLIAACEAALKRLGTDYIDLFQLHG